jgi:hypothetical protein
MKQVQVIICKCGSIFAACCVPECYQAKHWLNDIRKYSLKGCSIEMRDMGSYEFKRCACDKIEKQ